MMEVNIVSQKENPLLKRKEIRFDVRHIAGATPHRLEVRKAVADALKSNVDLIFVKKFETRPGTQTAVGVANLYDSAEQAKLIEPDYVIKRNVPPLEKPKEEEKKG
jgi:small subunit ribosomal protein S24e